MTEGHISVQQSKIPRKKTLQHRTRPCGHAAMPLFFSLLGHGEEGGVHRANLRKALRERRARLGRIRRRRIRRRLRRRRCRRRRRRHRALRDSLLLLVGRGDGVVMGRRNGRGEGGRGGFGAGVGRRRRRRRRARVNDSGAGDLAGAPQSGLCRSLVVGEEKE